MWKRTLAEKGVSPEAIGLLEECFDSDPAGRPADATVLLQRLEMRASPPTRDAPQEPETGEGVGRSRREETLKVLARHNVIQEGSEIEVIPEARPENADELDPKIFRARIEDVYRRKSVVWLHDDTAYALTNLTCKLEAEHGVQWVDGKTAGNWRIVGHTDTIWDEAEHFRQSAE
jgi:hypothetical protein